MRWSATPKRYRDDVVRLLSGWRSDSWSIPSLAVPTVKTRLLE